ncbi:MAG: glycosyltransferase [Planctomycetota bacterium]|nr:glycosyltransferase [Planctomycetota bacterium]
MQDQRVSIILCGYNQAEYLRDAIASALSQTHRNLELIVIDNGSTDGSRELLTTYRDEHRVHLFLHDDNAALTKRLNQAIAFSTGQYVSILYADDYYLPNKLERQLHAFSSLPPDYGVVYSPGYRIDALSGHRWIEKTLKVSGAILGEMFARQDEGFINPISPLIRKECLIDYPFHEDLFIEGESIYWRIAMTYKFHYIDEPLSVMREHAGNRGKAIKLNAQMVLTLFDKLAREPAFPPGLLPALERFRANFLAACGWLAIRVATDPRWARTCVFSAIRSRRQTLLRPRTVAALILSVLPVAGVRAFNRGLNAVVKSNERIAYRTDYS